MIKRLLCCGVLLALWVGLTGCTTSMKGTPFYDGEYEKNIGSAEDRVNLWPLLYYRDPAWSALWPIFEYSDEHYAARPLISYYGKGSDNRELNLLWPFGKFKLDQGKHRFFPFFWGPDYAVAAPLYYRFDEPFKGHGSSTLFPLWSYSADSRGSSLHLLWPFLHHSTRADREGWRLWPIAGSYNTRGDRYRFAAWPLGHQWEKRDGRKGDTLVPIYFREKDDDSERFLSLLYSYNREQNGDHSRLVVPLWYSEQKGDRYTWGSLLGGTQRDASRTNTVVLPALSWSTKTEAGRDTKLLLGLSRIDRAGSTQGSHLLPLYAHSYTDESSRFLSLLYSHNHKQNGDHSRLVIPLWYSQQKGDVYTWGSLLGGTQRSASKTNTMVLPALAWSTKTEAGRDTKLLLGLSRIDRAGSTQGSHLFPLYKHSYSNEDSLFLSLPYSSRQQADGGSWRLIPPLWYSQHDPDGRSWRLTLLYGDHRRADNSYAWRALVPFIYSRTDPSDRLVATLLGGYHAQTNRTDWLALPLLAGGTHAEEAGQLWYLAGLGRLSWGEQADGRQWLFPLYYRNARTDAAASLLYCRWHGQARESTTTMVPPLLSWREQMGYGNEQRYRLALGVAGWDRSNDKTTRSYLFPLYAHNSDQSGSRLWYLAGLGRLSWGEQADGRQWLFPLYYRNARTDAAASLLYCRWHERERESTTTMVPPLLSWREQMDAGNEQRYRLALGLAGWDRTDEKTTRSHLFPLYAHDSNQHLYTPLAGYKHGDRGFRYFATPLVGVHTGTRSGGWIFPLWSRTHFPKTDNTNIYLLWGNYHRYGQTRVTSGFFPLFGYKHQRPTPTHDGNGYASRRFWCLPICWYNKRENWRNTNPISIKAARGDPETTHTTTSAGVFPLYGLKSRIQRNPDSSETRTTWNVLFRLMDYRAESKTTQKEGADTTTHDYTRSRVLWRVYHRETLNGAATTDIFPGMTFDRSEDGRRSVSLLWHFLAYKREPDGGRKLHLLFIPIRLK